MPRRPVNYKDLTDQRFGKLVVVRRAPIEYKKWVTKWVCLCDCGNEVVVIGSNLKKENHTTSCGCYRDKLISEVNLSHGKTKTPEYNVWSLMKRRCYKKGSKQFDDYGGRGITVCDRWLNSFDNFINDMGERPSSRHTLERKNNNGPYCPENCIWATRLEQCGNKRNNRMITINGETMCLSQWIRKVGTTKSKVEKRVIRKGMTYEQALLIDS